MSTSVAELSGIARALRLAEDERAPIDPPSATHPGLSVAEAYDVQRMNRDRRVREGARIVGHKIGLTSAAMQQMLGVDTPDVGSITDSMVLKNGSRFLLDELVDGHIEAEFAFRLARALPRERVTREELRAAIDGVAVSAEIIDSRIRDWRISLVDTVADNASSARIVTGDWVPATPELLDGLPEMTLTLHEDGVEIAAGPGAAVLGDPLNALRWLAGTLARQGTQLNPGDVVLAGAVHRMRRMRAGAAYTVRAAGFAPAQVLTFGRVRADRAQRA